MDLLQNATDSEFGDSDSDEYDCENTGVSESESDPEDNEPLSKLVTALQVP